MNGVIRESPDPVAHCPSQKGRRVTDHKINRPLSFLFFIFFDIENLCTNRTAAQR